MQTCFSCNLEFPLQEKECPNCQKEADATVNSTVATGGLLALHAKTVQLNKGENKASIDEIVGSNWTIEEDSVSYNFIRDVEAKFKRKNKFHSFYDQNSPTLTNALLAYAKSNATSVDFDKLVKVLTTSLKTELFKVLGSTNSSSIVFTHYKDVLSNSEFDLGRLLVVMVDKKDGFDFTDDHKLYPKKAAHINLTAMKQAVRIDLQMFHDSFPINESKPYLKFIRGNSSAEYFRTAFGCVEKVDNGESLENLYKAIEEFATRHNLDRRFESKAQEALDLMLDDLLNDKSRSSFSIDEAGRVIESAAPKSLKLEGTFVKFVNEEEKPINHFIEPTKGQVEKQRWIDFSDSSSGIIAKALRPTIGVPNSGETFEYNESNGRISWLITDDLLKDRIQALMKKD
ncbi:nucleoid-associated protein [Vibrio sp. La 4.2.2]|uniref:nucleoid-associated protein n=1 Tax=Vibrio sp. La 4.2.2 TaxID=2998830 RepID=UPI0022CDFD4A|nr:nucleoid-associated protein [Vibrio sp. La 4.2.2]MDA0107812.1 nucleoid-associated protein [Vibrio sp. La 4.2.2]